MNQTIAIQSRTVGDGHPVFVIAEAGSNHDQKLARAKELIDVAVQSGADAVKFQLFKAESLYAKDHAAFPVVKANEFPREWLKTLSQYAKAKKIIFLATPFDREAVDLLIRHKIPAFKWGSSETANLDLLKYASEKNRPMLVSTGMCDLADVQQAMDVMTASGCQDVVLMHCASVYPCPPKDTHLKVMDTLKQAFQVPVGFSDHSLGIALPIAAVARGASVIEKHFTLSRKLKGPDHSYALEPSELKEMVNMIKEVRVSLGSAVCEILPEEAKYGRRDGLYAAKTILRGQVISAEDIRITRPAIGIRSRYHALVLGKKASRIIPKDKPIHWEHLRS